MNRPDHDHHCTYYEGLAAEYAVTDLDGRARGQLLVHLEHCPRCRHAVCEYTEVADILLGLFPAIEPPLGFETRTLARLERDRLDADTLPVLPTPATPSPGSDTTGRSRPRPRRRRRPRGEPCPGTDPVRPRAGAGHRTARALRRAAAALVLGIGVAIWFSGPTTPPDPAPVPPAPIPVTPTADAVVLHDPLTRDGNRVGQIYAYPGPPTWLQIVVDPHTSGPRTTPPGTTTLNAELDCRDGDTITVGPVTVTNGTGAWAGPVTVDPYDLTGARLTDLSGGPYASADLTD